MKLRDPFRAVVIATLLSLSIPASAQSDVRIDSAFGEFRLGGADVGGKAIVAVDTTGVQTDEAFGAVELDNGEVIVVGSATATSGPGAPKQIALAKLDANGKRDVSYGTNGIVRTGVVVELLARVLPRLDATGRVDRILVLGSAGSDTGLPGDLDAVVVQLRLDGTPDPAFGNQGMRKISFHSGIDIGQDFTLTASGAIIVVARPTGVPDDFVALARLTPAGAVDTSFGNVNIPSGRGIMFGTAGGNDQPEAVILQPDGRIVVGYTADPPSGSRVIKLARVFDNGSALDPTFGTGGQRAFTDCGSSGSLRDAVIPPLDTSRIVVIAAKPGAVGDTVGLCAFTVGADGVGITRPEFDQVIGVPAGAFPIALQYLSDGTALIAYNQCDPGCDPMLQQFVPGKPGIHMVIPFLGRSTAESDQLDTVRGMTVLSSNRVLLLGGLTRTAAIDVDYAIARFAVGPDITPLATQPSLHHPLLESGNCFGCHLDQSPGKAYMPADSWQGSMMANAGRDPLFWAALDVANADYAGSGEFCLRCHSSRGWTAQRITRKGSGILNGPLDGTDGCGLLGDHDDKETATNDHDGIGCHMCHRVMDKGPAGEAIALGNGNIWLDDSDCPNGPGIEPCRRGPYNYTSGADEPPHAWAFSPLHVSGKICGNCHDVSSPVTATGLPVRSLILNNGVDTGRPFPIERTFSEWSQSDFGDGIFSDEFNDAVPNDPTPKLGNTTCQGCHMRLSDDPSARACTLKPEGTRNGNLPVHEFMGANVFITTLVKNLYGGSGGLNRVAAFDRYIAQVRSLLQTRTSKIDVRLEQISPTLMRAHARVTNLAGHKLPTGYGEGRRAWLEVTATNVGTGAVFFRSGHYDATNGVLEQDPQVHVYEVLQGIWNERTQTCETADANGKEMFHFVLNNCVAKDNRIPPKGLQTGNVDTQPVGASYPETRAGSKRLVNFDDVTYDIPVPVGASSLVRVSVELRHQVATKEYVDFLSAQAADRKIPSEDLMCGDNRSPLATGPRDRSRGLFMLEQWQNQGRSPPESMGQVTQFIIVTP